VLHWFKNTNICRYFTTENQPMVKIFVGKDHKMWVLPEEFICDRVAYFKSAFKSDFKEGLSKELYLEDDEPAIFARVVNWIFGSFVEYNDTFSMQDCLKLFVLADKINLQYLKRNALHQFRTFFGHCIKLELHDLLEITDLRKIADAIRFIYSCPVEAEASEIRGFIVSELCEYFICARDRAAIDVYKAAVLSHSEFADEVMNAVANHMWNGPEECQFELCVMHNGLNN
jgi:hypothetical protein